MPKGFRRGLTPDTVLDAAFALVDQNGAEALTMRSLARKLGVAPMATYNHFTDREALLDALAERAFAYPPPGTFPVRRSRSWRVRLKTILTDVQRLASLHPHIYRLAMTRPNKPASAFRLMSDTMAALREAGLTERQVATTCHTFLMVLVGFPFWCEAHERHREQSVAPSYGMAPSRQAARDWATIHRVDAEKQLSQSLDWMLDAIGALNLNVRADNRSFTKPSRRYLRGTN